MRTHSLATLKGHPYVRYTPRPNCLNRCRGATAEDAEDDQHGGCCADGGQDVEYDKQAEGDDINSPPAQCLRERGPSKW